MKKKTLLSWSSGKDSAWALHLLRQDPTIDLLGLFAVMNQKYNRLSMHATRLEMLQRQAKGVDLPLQTINLPDSCTNEQCDAIMRNFVTESTAQGIQCMAFGDIFLEDVRKYRESQLKGLGLNPFSRYGIFPPDNSQNKCSRRVWKPISAVLTLRNCHHTLPDASGQET